MSQPPTQTAVITISLWRDRDDEAPLMARLFISQDGSRPHVEAAVCDIDAICDTVRAFLLLNFS